MKLRGRIMTRPTENKPINSIITKNMTLAELVHCASSDKRYYEGLALKVLEDYTPAPSPNELKTQLEEAFNDGLEEGQKEAIT
tara:strand:+ start:1381 stop:1629 length:249 start_codon:yes stop_codon:yes gene_type:complete